MGATTPATRIAREQNHLAWDPAIPPVATIGSGDLVELDCLDASNGQLTAESTTESRAVKGSCVKYVPLSGTS